MNILIKSFMYALRVFLLSSVMLFCGCAATMVVVGKAATIGMFPSSDYINFTAMTDFEVNRQYDKYWENSNRPLSDNFASYFFESLEAKNTGAFVTLITNTDRESLRSAFLKGRGLLLPSLMYGDKSKFEPDWKGTAKIRSAIQQKFGLDMVSLDVSKKVFKELYEVVRVHRASGGGNIWDPLNKILTYKSYEEVIKKYEGEFDFVVLDADENLTQDFGVAPHVVYSDELILMQSAQLKFLSASMLKNWKQGGQNSIHSMCRLAEIDIEKKGMDGTQGARFTPSSANRFSETLINRKLKLVDHCAMAFRSLGFEGSSKSNRLR